MALHAPKFWYQKVGLSSRLLKPISWIWAWQTNRRLTKKGHKLDIPVICVGNITMGGTGKTPTVLLLVERLKTKGMNPYILSRGFGGEAKIPRLVLEDHDAKQVGDEAKLMSLFAPVIVAKDRAAGGLLAQELGADIVVMDDGFQNPDLVKTHSIIVVDSDVGFGNGQIFPAGPMRETLKSGLARADQILFIGNGKLRSDLEQAIGDKSRAYGRLHPIDTGIDWKTMRVFAFAGIGRPEKFFQTLRDLGAQVLATRSFGDHEVIPEKLLNRMEKEAWALAATLVTTEKDAMRLPPAFQASVLSVPVRLVIDEGEILPAVL